MLIKLIMLINAGGGACKLHGFLGEWGMLTMLTMLTMLATCFARGVVIGVRLHGPHLVMLYWAEWRLGLKN